MAETNNLIKQADKLYQQMKYQKAQSLYEKALASEPNNAVVYQNLAACFLALQNTEAALIAVKRALELDNGLAKAHSILGNLFYRQGKYPESVQACKTALALNPNQEFAYVTLGLVEVAAKNFSQAETHFQTAVKIAPDNVPFQDAVFATVYELRGAKGTLQEALAVIRRSPTLHNLNIVLAYGYRAYAPITTILLFGFLITVFLFSVALPFWYTIPIMLIWYAFYMFSGIRLYKDGNKSGGWAYIFIGHVGLLSYLLSFITWGQAVRHNF